MAYGTKEVASSSVPDEEDEGMPRQGPRTCEACRQAPAEVAVQDLGDDKPSTYRLDSHIRGLTVHRLCKACADKK
jgi:hypothetical protein